jgi:hypothetical protein
MPILPADCWLWRDAFLSLNRSRSYGMGGPNPLSLSDIAAYWHWFEPDDDAEMFLYLIQAVDSAYISAMKQKINKETPHHGR